MSYIVSWSGGKDCCFAYYKAIQEGYNVSHLLNFVSQENQEIYYHGIHGKLIQLQAKSLQLPLIQKEVNWGEYTQEFSKTVQKLAHKGVIGVIFGDIFVPEFKIQKHKEWGENICRGIGIEAIEPLWELDPEKIVMGLINNGFEAIIVSAKTDLIEKEWIGQKLSKNFLKYLKRNKIDICGEKGEYHTFITNCPMFNKKIIIKESKIIRKNNFQYLNIIEYSLEKKGRKE